MPSYNHRSKAPNFNRNIQNEANQRPRARHHGRDNDNADIDGRHSSQRHHARIAQTSPREGGGASGDGYIQLWLKQTQSHRNHEPSSANESRQVPLRLHTRENHTNANKRARSPPNPVISPRRGSHRELDYRFQKRSRHKVREDKYEYQENGIGKRRPGQRAMAQDRSSQQAAKGNPAQDSHPTNIRGRARSSKGLAERAMNSRNARMEQKEQDEDNEMEQLRAFFQQRTSNQRPPPQEKYTEQGFEGTFHGIGSEAPWSRASSPRNERVPVDRRPSKYASGSPGVFEERTLSHPYGKRMQASQSHTSRGPHHIDAKSTSYATWSTSHHSEFFDEQFNGAPAYEWEDPRDINSRSQAQLRLRSRNTNDSNAQRPPGYKDAGVQTEPIDISPLQFHMQSHSTGTGTARQAMLQRNIGGTGTTALERPQSARRQEQAPEHHLQIELDTKEQSTGSLLIPQAQPVYAPLRRPEYFQGPQNAREVLVVRDNTDRETYPEVARPVLLLDGGFGSRLFQGDTKAPQQNQQLQAVAHRHAHVEDEEWLPNPVARAPERPILSPGGFAPPPPQEDRGIVDFNQARYQIEGPRQRSPTRGIADFIYEIEREAVDSRRQDGDAHNRNPGITDTQLERAIVPWSSSHPSRPGWFGSQQPLDGHGSGTWEHRGAILVPGPSTGREPEQHQSRSLRPSL